MAVISIVGTFNVGTKLVGQVGVTGLIVQVPSVYRPHSSVCGTPTCGDGHVCGGIAGTLFGVPTFSISLAQAITVPGVPSAQAFGVIGIKKSLPVGGVPTAQAFGVPTPHPGPVTRQIQGVPSAQAFGTAFWIYNVWERPLVCTPIVLAADPESTLALTAAPTSAIDLQPSRCS